MWTKCRKTLVAISLIVVGACKASAPEMTKLEVTVGAKPFAEQRILSQILIKVLSNAGVEVGKGPESLTGIRGLLEGGSIDAYWEYTGTAFLKIHSVKKEDMSNMGREDARKKLNELEGDRGLHWLRPGKVDNTFVLVLEPETHLEGRLQTIGQLIEWARGQEAPTLCIPPGFNERVGDGLKAFQDAYDYRWPKDRIRVLPGAKRYRELVEGRCDALVGYKTDSLIQEYELEELKDNEKFFPSYWPAPVFRQEVLEGLKERQPFNGIIETLECLADKIDTDKMKELNRKVEIEGHTPVDVAGDFLKEGAAGNCLLALQ